MNDNIRHQLNIIKIEDFIWIVYFFVITFAIISNFFERKFLFDKDRSSFNNFHNINTIILIVVFLIYLYLFILSYDNLKKSDPIHFRINFWQEVAATMFLIAGVIFIINEFNSRKLEERLEFT